MRLETALLVTPTRTVWIYALFCIPLNPGTVRVLRPSHIFLMDRDWPFLPSLGRSLRRPFARPSNEMHGAMHSHFLYGFGLSRFSVPFIFFILTAA